LFRESRRYDSQVIVRVCAYEYDSQTVLGPNFLV
jgi:hypothetical protein